MKKCILLVTITAVIVFTNIAFLIPSNDPRLFEPRQKLSEYSFFTGQLSALQPSKDIVPYDINMALFSNYAEKLRFVKLPAGKKAQFTSKGVLQFPKGTILIKNFYFEKDVRRPGKGREILETRLLVNEEAGWKPYAYIWNREQTEAYYDVAGDIREVKFINASGRKKTIQYVIPNNNQCKGCHIRAGQLVPIGPTAAQLNKEFTYSATPVNQLSRWVSVGILEGLPNLQDVAQLPALNDETASVDSRARAYLDVNCGNCHQPQGPANASGLFLNLDQTESTQLGILKPPVAAGRGAGNRLFDIVPGEPHKSILIFRMQTSDPGIAMPELGREQVHSEGVALIKKWIAGMKR
jgi:uncharacterized repeat protein (TIGR03806 family)